jgi:calreticulin
MRTTQDARFYAVSRRLETPFSNEGKDLVVQFATKNEKKESSFCGGGYIKLMPSTTNQEKFGGESPYHIMFGPDLCGYDVSRVHLIFSKDGENMLKKDDIKLEWADKNEFTHLYTLIVRPDNSYEVLVDGKSRDKGSLGNGQWSKFPAKEIDDPSDKKPEDWEENPKIVDPAAKKPDDWDENEPQMIKDPAATKPADWDDSEDGEWEAPMINNPKYKGKWNAPMIDNPKYKGVWAPKKIPNPDYVPTSYIYKDIGVVGFELWVVNSGSIFSNIIITDSVEEADKLAKETFHPFVEPEKDAKKAFDEKNKPKEEAKPADDEGGSASGSEASGGDGDDDDDKEEL